MMNKFLFLCFSFFSFYVMATSSMDGITKYGYFDNDGIKNKIICGNDLSHKGSYAPTYECEIITNKVNVKWLVINNNDCSYYNINYHLKGEFYIECGILGQTTTSYYKYDERLKNWFLYKLLTEYNSADSDKAASEDVIIMPKVLWSIDNRLLKIKDFNNPNELIELVENKYKEKKYNEILALANANVLDLSFLSIKTVTKYNNLAFYYQQSGAEIQAISILNAIINRFPDRDIAYLNLADSYNALGKSADAKYNYQKYIEIMTQKGKQNRIPARVFEFSLYSN